MIQIKNGYDLVHKLRIAYSDELKKLTPIQRLIVIEVWQFTASKRKKSAMIAKSIMDTLQPNNITNKNRDACFNFFTYSEETAKPPIYTLVLSDSFTEEYEVQWFEEEEARQEATTYIPYNPDTGEGNPFKKK